MSALAEQHYRYQCAKARLWGDKPRRTFPVPAEAVAPSRRRLFTRAIEEVFEPTPFNFLKTPGPRALVKLAALKHSISVADVVGIARSVPIVAARQEAMWLIRTHCPHLSLPEIGLIFGRDHSTVYHSVNKVSAKRGRLDA